MDRLAAGIIIAIAALVMSGGLVRDAQAAEPVAGAAVAETAPVKSLPPVAIGPRSELVLSLLLTLEALRSASGLLDTSKV